MTEIVLITALVALVVGFGSGWKVNEWKESASKVAAIEKAQAVQAAETKRADQIARDFEGKLGKQRAINKTFYNETRNETLKTVYTDCVVPDTGWVLLNRAIGAATAAAGQPDKGVPAAASPK